VAQVDLITPDDLLQLGATSDFQAPFRLRPLLVQIVVGGALGVMTFQWKRKDDTAYGPVHSSEAAAPWALALADPGFGVLTFADGTYVAGDVYTVSSAGVVTGGSATGVGLLSATRFDVIALACTSATSKGVTWLKPRCVPPILSVGLQIKQWLVCIAKDDLKGRDGLAPEGTGVGDDNTRARAKDAEAQLKAIGASADRPDDLVDSSTDGTGAGLPVYPMSDDPTGF